MKKKFGDFSVMRMMKHTFLGMNIEINNNIAHIELFKQMRECMTIFGDDVSAPVLYP